MPPFEVIRITSREVIARGVGIHEQAKLRAKYGGSNWRKCKGEAIIGLPNGRIRREELHWYEAHGVGKVRMKRKRYLDR